METTKYLSQTTREIINVPECVVYGVGYPVACEDLESACRYAREESEKDYNEDTRFYVVTLQTFHRLGYYQKGKWHKNSSSLSRPDIEKRIKANKAKR